MFLIQASETHHEFAADILGDERMVPTSENCGKRPLGRERADVSVVCSTRRSCSSLRRSWDSRTFARRGLHSRISNNVIRGRHRGATPGNLSRALGRSVWHPAAARTAATWPASALPAATRPAAVRPRPTCPALAGSTSISAAARGPTSSPEPNAGGRALHRHAASLTLHKTSLKRAFPTQSCCRAALDNRTPF